MIANLITFAKKGNKNGDVFLVFRFEEGKTRGLCGDSTTKTMIILKR